MRRPVVQRSWAYLFYDLALFAVLLLPLGLIAALIDGRDTAVSVYGVVLIAVAFLSLLVTRFSALKLGDYWHSLKGGAAR